MSCFRSEKSCTCLGQLHSDPGEWWSTKDSSQSLKPQPGNSGAARKETRLDHILMAHWYVTSSRFMAIALNPWQNLRTHEKVPTVSSLFLVQKEQFIKRFSSESNRFFSVHLIRFELNLAYVIRFD